MSVLHRPEVVDIGVKSYIEKHAICLKDYKIRIFLSIRHAHGDLCKHLGIDSSTDLDDRKYKRLNRGLDKRGISFADNIRTCKAINVAIGNK